MTALSIGLSIPGYFLMHGSAPTTPPPAQPGVAQPADQQPATRYGQALQEADTARQVSALLTGETLMQACYDEKQSFEQCSVTPAEVQLVRATPTDYLLQVGSLSASYNTTANRTCHASAALANRCDAW